MTSDEIPPKNLKAFEQRENRPSNQSLRQRNPPMISPAINVIIEDVRSVQIPEPNPPSQQSNTQMSLADELDNNLLADDESATEKSTTLEPATAFSG